MGKTIMTKYEFLQLQPYHKQSVPSLLAEFLLQKYEYHMPSLRYSTCIR